LAERLLYANKRSNKMELNERFWLGEILFSSLHQYLNLPREPIPFDEELFLECGSTHNMNLLSKPLHALLNSPERFDPDRPHNFANLFVKNQVVTKLEKLFSTYAKPGQTLVCFKFLVHLILGPVVKYMSRIVDAHLPGYVHIQYRASEERLDAFIQQTWKAGRRCTTNDYSQFDRSQRGETLAMEVLLMRHLSIPEAIIDYYIDIKTEVTVFTGTLALLRNTGEDPTFFFNTMMNMAYTNLKFDLVKSHPAVASVYGGDDMAINQELYPSPHWHLLENEFYLQSKLDITEFPTFCGWYLTPKGIYKSPMLLNFRILHAIEQDKLRDCIFSIALDHKFLYTRFELLRSYLPPHELDHVSTLNNYLTKHVKPSLTTVYDKYAQLDSYLDFYEQSF